MKIAFLTPEYPHPKVGKSGGIGTSLLNLAKGLKALGHQILILVYGQNEDESFIDDDIQFYKIKNRKIKGVSAYFTQKKVQKLINKLYEENKVDIVEVPDWTGFSAFINVQCPIVIKLHGSDTYFCHLDNRKVKFKNYFLEKKAFKKAGGILSVSEFTGKLTNQLFDSNRKFEVIHNGIDINNFKSNISQSEESSLLYFGTLIRKKGVLELPEIFNHVHAQKSDVQLIVVGKDSSDLMTGSNSTWKLMQPLFSEEAFKKVKYLGEINYSEMPNLINEASVCVFPTFAEALPVSWLEAMAMKKAIVASDIGWAKEVIDDGENGFLVHPTNHKKYADAIDKLLKDSILLKEFGIKARQKVKSNFENELIAEKTVAFYNKIIISKS
ncbi:glycosyltransferase family 4 protein [Winogradskyella ursingii]|uniref:glycosyltransferase family 4 protein n=1 Tax=Winogradskyella ursingii TaxID=2686079 RepID=UPI0015C871C3|nr:glycosyltransferase family 4 protein [Winogradskyella ursingii]